jgi:hypothetical protein
MADTKISALPASTTPLAGTEVLPIVQSGATKQVSVANLTAGRAISATQLTLTTGNVIVASGQGIDFSATPGTGTSELLNDYEEGTWTPNLVVSSGSVTVNSSFTKGAYTKVGRLVTLTGLIDVDSVSTPGGTARVLGLPFTPAGSGSSYEFRSAGSVVANGLQITAISSIVISAFAADASFYVEKFAAGAVSALGADLKAGSSLIFSITYMTN